MKLTPSFNPPPRKSFQSMSMFDRMKMLLSLDQFKPSEPDFSLNEIAHPESLQTKSSQLASTVKDNSGNDTIALFGGELNFSIRNSITKERSAGVISRNPNPQNPPFFQSTGKNESKLLSQLILSDQRQELPPHAETKRKHLSTILLREQ